MKKVKICKDGLVIVDETGEVINRQSWASISLAFMAYEEQEKAHTCFALAEDAREFWEELHETTQYRKWSDSL